MILSHCTLTFEHATLFDDFHFELKENQWTCLVGKSGVGKSSLLKIIAGLLQPKSITLSDNPSVSYLPQQDCLMPWLSVWENSLLGYTLRRETIRPALHQKALSLLTAVGLESFINKRPDILSGGMRQRVALVRTLLEDKPIILMDEPFASLDMTTRLELHTITADLLRDKTILLVTHDPLDAIRLGDTVHLMNGSPAIIQESFFLHQTLDMLKPRNMQSLAVTQQYMQLLEKLCQL